MDPQAANFEATARAIEMRADKHASVLLKAVRPLVEGGYVELVQDLKLLAYQFGWDRDNLAHIYDRAQPDWPEAQYTNLPATAQNDLNAFRQLLALRNAYVILVKKCQGHKVEHLIRDIQPGRPRAVLDRIHAHFYPNEAKQKVFDVDNVQHQHNHNRLGEACGRAGRDSAVSWGPV